MKKLRCVVGGLLLGSILSACQTEPKNIDQKADVSTVVESKAAKADKKTTEAEKEASKVTIKPELALNDEVKKAYFDVFKDAYQAHSADEKEAARAKGVWDPLIEEVVKKEGELLLKEHPQDQEMIYDASKEFIVWALFDHEFLKGNLTGYDNQLHPSLSLDEVKNSFDASLFDLSGTTVDGQPTVWNLLGHVEEGYRAYDYIILDIYAGKDEENQPMLYLFTWHHTAPEVLVAYGTIEEISSADFTKSYDEGIYTIYSLYISQTPNYLAFPNPYRGGQ